MWVLVHWKIESTFIKYAAKTCVLYFGWIAAKYPFYTPHHDLLTARDYYKLRLFQEPPDHVIELLAEVAYLKYIVSGCYLSFMICGGAVYLLFGG